MDKLDEIHRLQQIANGKLDEILKGNKQMAADFTQALSALAASVKETTDVELSAAQTIDGIAAALKASATDPAQVKMLSDLADQLHNSAATLAANIVTNTPAADGGAVPA